MSKIISFHSFRGGTGKSNTTANVASLLVTQGYRVGVIDTDIQSPGIHVLFGLEGIEIATSLNDYLWHGRDIQDTAQDVTSSLGQEIPGQLFLIPSSIKPGEITRVLREGYSAKKLTMGLTELVNKLSLDFLLIDTHPGLNEETLLAIVVSHTLVVVLRPDKQDYEGTGITIKVAGQLDVPRIKLVVNNAPTNIEPKIIKTQIENAYGCPVAVVIPHTEEMLNLASEGIFAIRYPGHPMTQIYKSLTDQLIA